MGRLIRHRPGYHEWASSTPVVDAIGTVVAVASVVIGAYAALFMVIAYNVRRWDLVVENAVFFVFIAIANGAVDALRRWRRHHA